MSINGTSILAISLWAGKASNSGRKSSLACLRRVRCDIEFSKRRQADKLFCEISTHELVQPLLDKCSNGEIDVTGPGRRSVNNDVRLKGKYFSVSKHPMRKSCVACAYQKKLMANRKRQKHQTFAKNILCLFAKNVFTCTIPKVMFRSKFYCVVIVSEQLSQH